MALLKMAELALSIWCLEPNSGLLRRQNIDLKDWSPFKRKLLSRKKNQNLFLVTKNVLWSYFKDQHSKKGSIFFRFFVFKKFKNIECQSKNFCCKRFTSQLGGLYLTSLDVISMWNIVIELKIVNFQSVVS